MAAASISQQVLNPDPEALRSLLKQNLVGRLLEQLKRHEEEEVDVLIELTGALRNLVSVAPNDTLVELINVDVMVLLILLAPKVFSLWSVGV
jgi:hypothetical protein